MEENNKKVTSYYVPLHKWEREKNEIYADINKKAEINRDRIEAVDDKHTEAYNKLRRNLDRNSYEIQTLNNNVNTLNGSIEKLTNIFEKHDDFLDKVDNRLAVREQESEEAKKKAEEKKTELYKLLAIIIPSVIGAGGLLSWLSEFFR